MDQVNINTFMNRFHVLERDLFLFDSTIDGEHWWDSVRFDACYFLFDCLTGLSYSSAHAPQLPARKLGQIRRWALRQRLFAQAVMVPRDLLVIRAPRSEVNGHRHDVVLDPLTAMFAAQSRAIDTLPRRYHLPDRNPVRWPGRVPTSLPDIVHALLEAFDIHTRHAAQLDELIRRNRGEYESQVAGYNRLFDRLRPRAVLMVQNGIEKALFHVAHQRGIPAIEAQHGLIGHGHPAYSYSREIDYSRQTGLPDLFLTFSTFWQESGYYPARHHAVIGTDHFASGFAGLHQPLGVIMVITANIYHDELMALTRDLAIRLPHRSFLYKLHPNQKGDEPSISAALADLPNVVVGDPSIPASHLMGDVSHLVAIQSTVVYEALQHGRRICIVPRHDHHIHADIFHFPEVAVPANPDAFVAALEMPSAEGQGPTFFERFDAARAREILAPYVGQPGAGPAAS